MITKTTIVTTDDKDKRTYKMGDLSMGDKFTFCKDSNSVYMCLGMVTGSDVDIKYTGLGAGFIYSSHNSHTVYPMNVTITATLVV